MLLAGLGPERLTGWFELAPLERVGPQTITDRALLTQQIEAGRREGYATAEEELAAGVVSLAVPVRDAAGRVVAALNLFFTLQEAAPAALASTRRLRDASSGSAEAARCR